MHEALLSLATELVGVKGICEIVVDVRRVQGRNEVGERVPVRGLVETAERCVPINIDIVGELRSGLLGQICDSCEVILMPGFERVLDALVQFLIAAGCFDSPKVAAADDRGVLGVEIEGEVDLVEGA